jgi:plastocyanin
MRASWAILLVVLFGFTSVPASAATIQVQVIDSEFTPDPTINVGDTVRWVWNSFMSHNVRSAPWEAVTFDSGHHFETGHTYEYTFTSPGVVDYYCDLHGFPITSNQTISGMGGRITVVAIPEPTGIAVFAPLAMLLARRSRRPIPRV